MPADISVEAGLLQRARLWPLVTNGDETEFIAWMERCRHSMGWAEEPRYFTTVRSSRGHSAAPDALSSR